MNILLIVNSSPWGGTRALAAWRFLNAWMAAGQGAATVFFRGEGVYNALVTAPPDPGTPDLPARWSAAASDERVRVLVCSAAAARRLPADAASRAPGMEDAGLLEVTSLAIESDRVVTF